MGTTIAQQRTKLCSFFRYNEPTEQWLEIDFQGRLHCSCGSDTLLVNRGTLIGCAMTIEHGSRNIPDVVSFIQGHIANLELAVREMPNPRHRL